jgi:hypothetical protein
VLVDASGAQVTAVGTAFLINPTGYLLTAAHILKGNQSSLRPFINMKDGTIVPASVIRFDIDLDIAVLFARVPQEKYFALSANPLTEIGSRVTFGGYPDTYNEQRGIPPPSFRRAGVSSIDSVAMGPTERPRQMIKLDQASNPGHSGGPVFSDESFAVIGVMRATVTSHSPMPVDAGIRLYQGFSLVTPIAYVRPLISDVETLTFLTEPPEAGSALRWYKSRLRQELLDHLDVARANKALFESNTKSLAQGKESLAPPARYRHDAWIAVREDPRAETVIGKQLVESLRSYYFKLRRHQDFIEARESIRLGQWALSNRKSLLTTGPC